MSRVLRRSRVWWTLAGDVAMHLLLASVVLCLVVILAFSIAEVMS